MPFTPGKSGNPEGRPKGSTNKDTEIKRAIKDGIDIEELIESINELEGAARIDRLIKLLEFAYPKIKSMEFKEVEEERKPTSLTIITTDEVVDEFPEEYRAWKMEMEIVKSEKQMKVEKENR